MKSREAKKKFALVLTLLLWIAAAWLLLPLVMLDTVTMANAKLYLYRSSAGVTILLIFFGKTVFDLLFPHAVNKKMSTVNTVFLALYAVALASGIVFMIIRMVLVYLKNRQTGFIF